MRKHSIAIFVLAASLCLFIIGIGTFIFIKSSSVSKPQVSTNPSSDTPQVGILSAPDCGEPGQFCCDENGQIKVDGGGHCNSGITCQGNACVGSSVGAPGKPCGTYGTCNTQPHMICDDSRTCVECGGLNQPCCSGGHCLPFSNLVCGSVDNSDFKCITPDQVECGGPGQACCPNDGIRGPWCLSGQCNGSTCPGTAASPTPQNSPTRAPTPTTSSNVGSCSVDNSQVALDPEEIRFLNLVNQYRAQNGAGPLKVVDGMNKTAQLTAAGAINTNNFSHFDSQGRGPSERAAACGLSFQIGENLLGGYETAEQAFNAWKGSTTHRTSMLKPEYKSTGVARVFNPNSTYKVAWVQEFSLEDIGSAVPSNPSATPTLTPRPSTTTTPTPTTPSTLSVTVSPTIVVDQAFIEVKLAYPGIGNGVFNNKNPISPERRFILELLNPEKTIVATASSNAFFNYTLFAGEAYLENAIGSFSARIKPEFGITEEVSNIQLRNGSTIDLSPISVLSGDLNADNMLNILDYNILLSCFRNKCRDRGSDLNSDGVVNEIDFNIFLQNLLKYTER